MRVTGERLGAALPLGRMEWRAQAIDGDLAGVPVGDLTVLAYVLDELAPAARPPLVARAWDLARQVAVIVEPGTSEGWQRILAARGQLLDLGARILAPCPHGGACPVAAPDWCHFSARVARSRLHRLAKGGTVPWEDEKFIYLVAARAEAPARGSRILAPPARSKAEVTLKLCRPDARLERQSIARREGKAFKAASKLGWGDLWNP
jgi:ribosomal protein RSM22 (predicted rRNA methylase)